MSRDMKTLFYKVYAGFMFMAYNIKHKIRRLIDPENVHVGQAFKMWAKEHDLNKVAEYQCDHTLEECAVFEIEIEEPITHYIIFRLCSEKCAPDFRVFYEFVKENTEPD